MAAITSVEIENFRCFQKLRVDGLAQVNLIVGANNAGKTVLLEAIEAVVSRDSPFALYRSSLERNEYRRRRGADEDLVELDLRHWFHGHALALVQRSTFAQQAIMISPHRDVSSQYPQTTALRDTFLADSAW